MSEKVLKEKNTRNKEVAKASNDKLDDKSLESNIGISSIENVANKILNLLDKSPGIRAKEIALTLEIDKTDVNKLLYGNLSGKVRYNNSYEWFRREASDSSVKIDRSANVPLTDIERLCRYYLACLGQEEAGISTFAESKYDLDYCELKSLPKTAEELISEDGFQLLQGKKRADRSKLQMFLGYPANLRYVKSKKSDWEGYFVEPILLFPVVEDATLSSIQIDFSYPIINTKVLISFTNSEKDALMDELVQLEEELGITANSEEILDLDELVMRLQHIRKEWPWKEEIIPKEINDKGLKLSEIKEPGVFNKAIVVIAEKSPFTAGLESELAQLSKCSIESIKDTALGNWLEGNPTSGEHINDKATRPLIEVLPMNSEQRQAVQSSLEQKLTVITGPPGTGKSQVVTNLLVNSAWRNKKILFASKNNKAVDVVETRINNLGPRPILLRVGSQAYQSKLAEYLISLLSTTSTKTDQLEFDEAEELHTRLLKKSDSLDEDVVNLIESRNQVGELEQSVEEIRSRFDEQTFSLFDSMDRSKLKADIKALDEIVEKLVNNSNQVDQLEKSVEDIKSRLDDETVLSFKELDAYKLKTDIEALRKLLASVKKKGFLWSLRKQGLFRTANMNLGFTTKFVDDLGLLAPYDAITESNLSDWEAFTNNLDDFSTDVNSIKEYFIALEKLQISKSYSTANSNLDSTTEFLDDLGLSIPNDSITESNLDDWEQFIQQLSVLVVDVELVKKYFTSLSKLQALKSLEEISLQRSELFDSFANNSETLWKLWLKLQPGKLSQDDRGLLTRYRSILQMVIDTKEGERLERSVYREYKKASDQISHLLPCWAVTSLSVRNKIAFEPGFFDLVVFDESSQCDIASALPLLYRAKAAVIIGDPKQLAHISSLRRGQDQQFLDKYGLLSTNPHWAYSYNSLFSLGAGLSSQNTIINLVDHHRSHSDIIEFSNKEFYEDRLRVATRYDNLRFVDSSQPGVRWVNVQGQCAKSPSGGSINHMEVQAVIDELVQLVLARGYKGTVGVVTPFRAQANAIDAAILRNNELHKALLNRDYIANTVHKFQGDERDVMIFSPVLSKDLSSGSVHYLQNQGNLFNVAITRARAQLIVVGDLLECGSCDVDYLAKFAQYTQNLRNQNNKLNSSVELEYGGSKYPQIDNPEQVSDWEKEFYTQLYLSGVKTLPQYRVEKYALDLAIIDGERKLDIEIDGERYHRNWNGELCYRDQIRNQRMFELGWDVMRFWVYEIRDDLQSCIDRVKKWQAESQNSI